jgi:hypothetical protein
MSIEKALAQSLEPIVDQIVEIKKAVEQIERTPGPAGRDGRDADPVEVAIEDVTAALKSDGEFVKITKGDQGDRGEPGQAGQAGAGIETKTWTAGAVYRAGDLVMHNFGQIYKAAADTVAEPGEGEDWSRVGTFGFKWTGVKAEGKQYAPGDIYIDSGTSFLVLPTGEAKMLAQRGKAGKDGVDGRDGRDGHGITLFEITDDAIVVGKDGHTVVYDLGDVIERSLRAHSSDIEKEIAASVIAGMYEGPADSIPVRFFRGSWQAGNQYAVGDLVVYAGMLYICKEAADTVAPASSISALGESTKYWKQFSYGGGGSAGPGQRGATGPAGPIGPTGPQGIPGLGITFVARIPTVDDLPPTADNGDMYIVDETGDAWIWSGDAGAFENAGPIVGPTGPTGPAGPSDVSNDPGNLATLGSDGMVYVPATDLSGYLPLSGGTMVAPATIKFPDGVNMIQNASGFNLIGNLAGFYFRSGTANLFHLGVNKHQSFKPILLPADPVAALDAATKQYVDAQFASGGYVLPVATDTLLGGVKIGTGFTITPDGTISVDAGTSYTLPVATATVLGGIKVGTKSANQYVNGVAADGTLLWGSVSATGAPLRLPPTEVTGFNGVDAYWYQDTVGNVRLQMPGGLTGIFLSNEGIQTFTKLPICNIAPVDANHLVNKAYADKMLPTTGGTMTGTITLPTTIQSFTWGTTGFNLFGGSGGVAFRSNTTNIVNFSGAAVQTYVQILTPATGNGIQFGSSGPAFGRGTTATKIKSTGQIELPTTAPVGDEAISKNHADATYAAKALFDEMRAEIDTLKAEVAILKGA